MKHTFIEVAIDRINWESTQLVAFNTYNRAYTKASDAIIDNPDITIEELTKMKINKKFLRVLQVLEEEAKEFYNESIKRLKESK